MEPGFDHGPRLTDEEYERRISELHSRSALPLTREEERDVRRQELDLAIDHRLGCHFPHERRRALWEIQQRVEKKRLRLMFKHVLKRCFAKGLIRDVQGLASFLVNEYAKVLNQAELESFFGSEEVRNPVLPIDPGQLKG
jgi:hypothetical protein